MSNRNGVWSLPAQYQAIADQDWTMAPGAPTGISATAGDAQAEVSFTAPTFAGIPGTITQFKVTSSEGETATGSTSPITVSGLTNDTAYTFTVQAQNAIGLGKASDASSSVTPLAEVISGLFQTHLYDGTGSAQTITNDINLSGEGGLVWMKARNSAESNIIQDTDNTGVGNALIVNSTSQMLAVSGTHLSAFNSNGFSIGTSTDINRSGTTMASWTFRKAPKFFDIVTYTGTGVNRTISHNLGSTPGMIIVKRTDSSSDWACYHRGLNGGSSPATKYIRLNLSSAESGNAGFWNNTEPTSSVFSVGTNAATNSNGGSYVAYLFAHNNNDGGFGPDSEDIIKCGNYTGNGSTNGVEIDLGFEPQFVIVKRTDSSASWFIMDTMRGMTVGNGATGNTDYVNSNNNNAEDVFSNGSIDPTPTGFNADGTNTNINASSGDYIYIAIRRGGMRTPTAATDVFDVDSITTVPTTGNTYTSSFDAPDLFISRRYDGVQNWQWTSRLTQRILMSTSTAAEQTTQYNSFDLQDGVDWIANWSNDAGSYIQYFWKRARGFFDVVCYSGTGSAQNITHNLGVTPEFYIVKRRDGTGAWYAYHKSIDKDGDGRPETDTIQFNGNSAAFDSANYWNDTAPTATTFTVGTTSAVNASGGEFIAYLFASLDGIAKVGGYTGNGTSQTINCGFAPRFVFLTKWGPTGGGNKLVWDTERGIVAGNDPFLDFRNSNAQDSSYDFIDPDSNGFVISGTSGWVNASGSGYMFYAIA